MKKRKKKKKGEEEIIETYSNRDGGCKFNISILFLGT